ncbi:Uma2 family endonuclease [Glacieibacterium frigidum]|uniref:Uma2 family endonuclease n=1 Tax=Glacieibacterium frigidum TaxID=2593303 RepID=A0A552U8F1_9SPHN|nr:Uma2 family endonuclease [Glacieibacterium frigidum]TRW14493.1 Uma2 family endonuclease [Glacieibacterium frigidum]
MNVAEFLSNYADRDDRVELLDGVPVALPVHTARISRIAMNITTQIHRHLETRGCQVFGESLYLRVDDQNLLAPNAAIYCDRAELDGPDDVYFFCKPSVIFVILTPDEGSREPKRRAKFQAIRSVSTIVVIEPAAKTFMQYERASDGWSVVEKPYGSALELRHPAITLEADEMFRHIGPRTQIDGYAITGAD